MGQPRMDSSEAQTTLDTGQLRGTHEWTRQIHRQHWTHRTYSSKLTLDKTIGTFQIGQHRDTDGEKHTTQKTEMAINNRRSRETDNIGFDLFLVLNATFSSISAMSCRPVLVVEEAGVPGENHRPWASNW